MSDARLILLPGPRPHENRVSYQWENELCGDKWLYFVIELSS